MFFILLVRPPPGSNLTDTLFPNTTIFLSTGRQSYRRAAGIAGNGFGPFSSPPCGAGLFLMAPLALLIAAVAGWMWWTGRLRRMTGRDGIAIRSEEHTSELQSLMRNSYAGF